MATGKHSKPSQKELAKQARRQEREAEKARKAAAKQQAGQQSAGAQQHAQRVQPAGDRMHAQMQAASRVQAASQAQVPLRPKKRSKAPLIAVVVIIIVAAALAAAFFILGPAGNDVRGDVREGEQVTVTVEAGSSTSGIGALLAENGVIASSNEFVARVSDLGKDGSLQAGTYQFTGGQDLDQIIEALANGQTAGLTIPEGYTLKQIAQRVGEATDIDADEFYKLAHTGSADYIADYPFLKECYKGSMEGFLFPATYELSSDITADSLIRQMLDTCADKLASIDMTYAKSKNLTTYDIVTLASIVEKESRMTTDKAGIASVFYNRLKQGITLGSDVTTYYAVGKELTEDLTKADLASDSPYNTRNPKNYGLPPGAICNPGMAALEAAAHPDEEEYLYFFWSASQSKTMFFKTQAEFSAAWKKYGE